MRGQASRGSQGSSNMRNSWKATPAVKPQVKPDVRAQKGFGPNKASGHKGGISRQGSKRG